MPILIAYRYVQLPFARLLAVSDASPAPVDGNPCHAGLLPGLMGQVWMLAIICGIVPAAVMILISYVPPAALQ